MEEIIRQAIERVAQKVLINAVVVGTAKNVTDTQCDVIREGAPELLDVTLNAIEGNLPSYTTIVPKEGSVVLAGVIENRKREAFIVCCSEVEKVIWKCGNATYEFKDASVIKKVGDTVHAMTPNAHEIKTGKENLKAVLEDLIDEILKITVPTSAGPSGTPINAAAITAVKTRIPNLLS